MLRHRVRQRGSRKLGDVCEELDRLSLAHHGVPVNQRRWDSSDAAALINLFVLTALQEFRLSIGTCRAYARTAAQYLARCGATPNMHHVIHNPELKDIWAEAKMTSAGLVKRAAIIGIRFLRRARSVACRVRHGHEHYTGLLLSFFFFLRVSQHVLARL